MVQIKLAVVFILAVAAVAPVVALPIPVDQPSSGSKKGQKRKENPLKSKPPPPEPGSLPPLPPIPDQFKKEYDEAKKRALNNPIVYRTGELPAPPPKTGMMNPSGPSVLPDHLKGKPLPPLPVREPNKHASSSNPPIPKEDFNKPNKHASSSNPPIPKEDFNKPNIDQATLDLQAARRNNLFRNAHHIPLRLDENEGQQPKPPSLHIKSSFRKDLQQSTRNKIRKFTNFFKKS